MKEVTATITSKGQITMPADIRRHLGISPGDRVVFSVDDSGDVHVRPAEFSTVDSLAGAVGSLSEPKEWHEMLDIAREDAVRRHPLQ